MGLHVLRVSVFPRPETQPFLKSLLLAQQVSVTGPGRTLPASLSPPERPGLRGAPATEVLVGDPPPGTGRKHGRPGPGQGALAHGYRRQAAASIGKLPF